jgi:hypothetical protein
VFIHTSKLSFDYNIIVICTVFNLQKYMCELFSVFISSRAFLHNVCMQD